MGTMDPAKIKLKMYSTKVMGYREEERKTIIETHSSTRSTFGSKVETARSSTALTTGKRAG